MNSKTFDTGDYVVCPGHGVGQVLIREAKNLGSMEKEFYTVKIVANGMKVMVPVESGSIRGLVSRKEIDGVFQLLNDHDVEPDTSTWNRRQRDYLGKLKTGSLMEIADVLRSLLLLKISKKLSYGERQMLDQCKDLLVQEIALSLGNPEKEVEGKIESIFT